MQRFSRCGSFKICPQILSHTSHWEVESMAPLLGGRWAFVASTKNLCAHSHSLQQSGRRSDCLKATLLCRSSNWPRGKPQGETLWLHEETEVLGQPLNIQPPLMFGLWPPSHWNHLRDPGPGLPSHSLPEFSPQETVRGNNFSLALLKK